jgi:2-polyprenyl-3-methyl-5-hydroxy-6-metoxy-1,4-benzoquinol methylase
MNVPGSKGYEVDADALVRRYERVRPTDKYRAALHLIPSLPCRVMDIGAGSGVDAAWFASLGHEVFAVEPTAELRRSAMATYPSPRIHWMDDYLPHLRSVVALDETFELIVVAGVWTHLDETERHEAVKTIASLLAPDGVAVISIRQGIAPTGRLTFPVTTQETVTSAETYGLRTILNVQGESQQAANRKAGVTWNWLAFWRKGQAVRA